MKGFFWGMSWIIGLAVALIFTAIGFVPHQDNRVSAHRDTIQTEPQSCEATKGVTPCILKRGTVTARAMRRTIEVEYDPDNIEHPDLEEPKSERVDAIDRHGGDIKQKPDQQEKIRRDYERRIAECTPHGCPPQHFEKPFGYPKGYKGYRYPDER